MNYLSFRYFAAAAKADSIKQAAEALMIAPQSLSEHIRKLEQELGVELFTRSRPAHLTACGQRFLRYAESMLAQRYRLEQELRELEDKHREIVVSVSPTDLPPILPEVLAEFTARFPDCLVTIAERRDSMDLSAYDLNVTDESLGRDMTEILIQSPDRSRREDEALGGNVLSIVANRGLLRRVWGGDYEARLQALEARPSLQVMQEVPMIRFYNQILDQSVERLFQAVEFLPNVVAKSVSSGICAELCAAGMGYMIVPDGWAMRRLGHKISDGTLAIFRLPESYPMPMLLVSYDAGKQLTEPEQALIRLLQEKVRQLGPPD